MHYATIFAYCKLQGVSFQKLVSPHNDVGKSLYTFLKDGYIPEALLSNANPSNWGENLLQFQEILHCHCYKVSVGRKSVIVVTIGFTKFAKILITKIKFLKLTVKTNGFAATA